MPALGRRPLDKLTAEDVDLFYATLLTEGRKNKRREGTGLAPKTVRNIHLMLKAMGDAQRKGLVARNVVALADAPSQTSRRQREIKAWDAAQIRVFLDAIRSHRLHPTAAHLEEPSDQFLLSSVLAVDSPRFPVSHPYLEVVYGSLIGPTAVVLARNLDRRLADEPQPVVVHAPDLALELGLRSSRTDPLGRRSHLRQAIERLVHVHIVTGLAPNHLGLSTIILPATVQTLTKVPEYAVASHHCYMAAAENA